MGRKALPKLDPAIDYSRHFFAGDEIYSRCDPQDFFPHAQPLEVEVGSGKGLFMRTASGEQPARNFLGIEIAFQYARYSGYRLAKEKRDNAVMLHGDGQKFFREVLSDACLSAVHVYFPDPWWKARHHRRRVMNEEFAQQIDRKSVV